MEINQNSQQVVNNVQPKVEVKEAPKTTQVQVSNSTTTLATPVNHQNIIQSAIMNNAKSETNIKNIIDLAATGVALESESTTQKLVTEKTSELKADAEAKRIESETARVRAEVAKVREEAEKEIAQINKERDALQADVEKLQQLTNKSNAFFEANKSILRCIGVRDALSLTVMKTLLPIATAVFIAFQVLLLPLTLIGFMIESLTSIVGAICEGFNKNGLKILVAIISIILILALVVGVYWLVINYGSKLF